MDGKIRGLSPKTLRERQDVTGKLFWLAEREGWDEVGPAETGAFLAHVRTGHAREAPFHGRWNRDADGNRGTRRDRFRVECETIP